MEFKFSVIFGVILAVIVMAVANGVYMLDPAYVSPAVIVTGIVLTLVLTKLYLGKVAATMQDMLVTSIIWVIIVAVFDVISVFAFGLDMTEYFSNYMIYVGYVLIIVFALIGFKLFGSKSSAPALAGTGSAPSAESAPATA